MRNDYLLIFLILLAGITFHEWKVHQEKFYSGAVAPMDPVQEKLDGISPFTHDEYTVNPQAVFKVRALVLSANHFNWGKTAELSPVDLALGWGPMSDGDILKDIDVSQGSRWYYFSYQKAPPIPQNEIIKHSSNMHMIPATDEIEKKIKSVHKGDVVEFKGYLVNLTMESGWHWNSSLSRTDTGDGSCEVVWVNEFEIAGR